MINYNKNKLINECLTRYYETFAHTLDTADYVPKEFNEKILLYIFKNMKRQFKKIDREDRQYQKKIAARQKIQRKRGIKNGKAQEQEKQSDKLKPAVQAADEIENTAQAANASVQNE